MPNQAPKGLGQGSRAGQKSQRPRAGCKVHQLLPSQQVPRKNLSFAQQWHMWGSKGADSCPMACAFHATPLKYPTPSGGLKPHLEKAGSAPGPEPGAPRCSWDVRITQKTPSPVLSPAAERGNDVPPAKQHQSLQTPGGAVGRAGALPPPWDTLRCRSRSVPAERSW